MGDKTTIQWTDATWNPVTGCNKVSAGCKNCYAERVFPRAYGRDRILDPLDKRFPRTPRQRYFTDVKVHPERLDRPLHWKKPRRIFVNSMSDLFHEAVPISFIDEVFAVMTQATRHTYQVLTKRPERMRDYVYDWSRRSQSPLTRNVHLGVSVEDQASFDERVPLLYETPAALRFVSAEPLLAPIDFKHKVDWAKKVSPGIWEVPHMDWVVVGGESGPGARPCDVACIRSIMRWCKDAGVPVFVKQLGANPLHVPYRAAAQQELRDFGGRKTFTERLLLKDRKGGDPNEWPEDLRVREFPVTDNPKSCKGE